MTYINQMIRKARAEPKPEVLELPYNHLGTVAQHCADLSWVHDAGTVRELIMKGGVRFMGIPLKVVGAPHGP